MVLNSFNFVFASDITQEDITIFKCNDGYYFDYDSAYEDIQSLVKTEYPEGEGYFILKKVGSEWKIVEGFGEKTLLKVEPCIEKIEIQGETKYINGYRLTGKVKKELKRNSFSIMNLRSSGNNWREVARTELDPSDSDSLGRSYVDYNGDKVRGVKEINDYNGNVAYRMTTKWVQNKANAVYRVCDEYKDTGRKEYRIILILEECIYNSSPTLTLNSPSENNYFSKELPIKSA